MYTAAWKYMKLGCAHTHSHTHTHTEWWTGDATTREFACQSILSFAEWTPVCDVCVSACLRACVWQENSRGVASSDQRHAEGARTHQSEEQVLTRRHPRLILAALVRRKLVSSVYHLLCVLWPFSKKSPRVTTCKHCSFCCRLSFPCFSVQQQCCQT